MKFFEDLVWDLREPHNLHQVVGDSGCHRSLPALRHALIKVTVPLHPAWKKQHQFNNQWGARGAKQQIWYEDSFSQSPKFNSLILGLTFLKELSADFSFLCPFFFSLWKVVLLISYILMHSTCCKQVLNICLLNFYLHSMNYTAA